MLHQVLRLLAPIEPLANGSNHLGEPQPIEALQRKVAETEYERVAERDFAPDVAEGHEELV